MRLAKITASGMARPEGLWISLTAMTAVALLDLFVDELELVVLDVGQSRAGDSGEQRGANGSRTQKIALHVESLLLS